MVSARIRGILLRHSVVDQRLLGGIDALILGPRGLQKNR